MRHAKRSWIAGSALFALLAVPALLSAQQQDPPKHKHYTLVDLGTLGGPDSEVQGNAVLVSPRGEVAGDANTSVYDPGCGCYLSHAFKSHEGLLTDLGTLPGRLQQYGDRHQRPGRGCGNLGEWSD